MTGEGSWGNSRLDYQKEAGTLKIFREKAGDGFSNRIKFSNSLGCGMSTMSAQQIKSNQKLKIRGKAHKKDSVLIYHPFTTYKSEDDRNFLNAMVYPGAIIKPIV